MRRKKLFFTILSILFLIMLITYFAYTRSTEKDPLESQNSANRPIVVKTTPVIQGKLNPSLKLNGSVCSHKEIILIAKSPGTLVYLNARNGDRVKTGQMVAQIEEHNQHLMVDKANEQIVAARLALEKAEKDFSRIEMLYNQGVVSRTDFEEVEYLLQNTEVAYQVALQDHQLALKALEDTRIEAPITGQVVDCQVEAGQVVFAGTPLMTLVDDTQLKILATLTAEQLKLANVKQTAVFTTSVYPGKEFPCTVKSISSKANPANRSYAVELELAAGAAESLKPGMFGYLTINTPPVEGLVIPREALLSLDESGVGEVFVALEGQACKRMIKTGVGDNRSLTVFEGLKLGDKVVTMGQHLLKEGSLITEGE